MSYQVAKLRRPQSGMELERDCSALYHIFGSDLSRKGNLAFISRNILVYVTGNALIFEDIVFNTRRYLLGIDDLGIGCFAIHPEKTMLAVGGKGFEPSIYIYSYPELNVIKVLKGGAEKGYSSLSFNASGSQLASVSLAPDYVLTVWNWEEERIDLHSKAFGQDVYTVRFSIDDDRRLTTSGTGHIRFWKMAATFTGLKLQGYIGKFGKVELSDISAFVELPDGKVVSGTETGALLLWEGNFIKCRFTQPDDKLCHDGEVTYVELDRHYRCVVTAGNDGRIRWWDLNTVDTAEVDSDQSMDFEIIPLAEYNIITGRSKIFRKEEEVKDKPEIMKAESNISSDISDENAGANNITNTDPDADLSNGLEESGDGEAPIGIIPTPTDQDLADDEDDDSDANNNLPKRGIRAMVDSGLIHGERCFVILDSQGTLFSIMFQSDEIGIPDNAAVTVLSKSHAGTISAIDTCPLAHLALTCGIDGTIRCWNYLEKKVLGMTSFPFAATCLKWTPNSLDPNGMSATVGFTDGCVRVLSFLGSNQNYVEGTDAFTLTMVFKPHRVPVTALAFSGDGSMLATAGEDGTVFFFNCTSLTENRSWTPLRFISLNPKDAPPSSKKIICEMITWHDDNLHVLLSCNDGKLREARVEEIRLAATMARKDVQTFEHNLPIKEIPIMTTPFGLSALKKDDFDHSDSDSGNGSNEKSLSSGSSKELIQTIPAKTVTATYYTNPGNSTFNIKSDLIVSAVGGTSAQLLECSTQQEMPLRELKYGLYSYENKEFSKPPVINTINKSISGKFLISGTVSGNIIIRPIGHIETFLSMTGHNSMNGGVKSIASSFDDNFIISVGYDGVIIVHRLNPTQIIVTAKLLNDQFESNPRSISFMKKPNVQVIEGEEVVYEAKFLSLITPTTPLDGFNELNENTVIFPDRVQVDGAVDDISATAYCIEDEKLKSEDDVKREIAEKKKDKVRLVIQALQKEYEHLLQMNNRLPKPVQLDAEGMTVDGDYFRSIREKGGERLEEVRKECAYEAERALKLRQKLQKRLMDDILVEEISLRGFRQRRPIIVHSLRTRGMDRTLKSLVDAVHASVKNDMLADVRSQLNASVQRRHSIQATAEIAARHRGSLVGAAGGAMGSAAARREQRKKRQASIETHATQKPKEDEDDERDIRAIEHAEKSLGVYKLKCADDYEVPENQRVNAEKKRRQMVLLEENMITMSLRFNERFLAMRQLKRQLIESIQANNERICEIDGELGLEGAHDIVWEPVIDPLEFPDDREEVIHEELVLYKSLRQNNPWVKTPAIFNSVVTGLKTMVKLDPESGNYNVQSSTNTRASLGADASSGSHHHHHQHVHGKSNDDDHILEGNECVLSSFIISPDRSNIYKEISDLENSIPSLQFAKKNMSRGASQNSAGSEARSILERHRKLEYEKKILLRKTEENVKSFDNALDELRQERHNVTADLKLAELKLIVLYQEYMLLLTFEGRDNALQQKQLRCQREKTEINTSLAECQARVDSKLEDMKDFNDKLKNVLSELTVLVPDNHPFADILTKIFKKKMKRNRKGNEEQDDDEMEEEEDDDDDDEEEEEVDDNCPLGCEVSLFDKVLDLREKRLDQEESIAETQRAMDDLKKTMDRLKQREKQIDKDSRQTEAEIRQFQLQKQAALNVIEVVVPIRISQLYCFNLSGKLSGPSDKPLSEVEIYDINQLRNELKNAESRSLYPQMSINTHVLFKKQALEKLQQRIGELHKETDDIRTDLHALYKERVRLEKDREVQREEITKWTERINDCQLLKFGRLVNLDDLDQESDKTKEDEAATTIKKVEEKHDSLVKKLEEEKDKLKDEIAEATRRNTELLREVAGLANTKLSITRDLNANTDVKSQLDSKQNAIEETEEKKRIASYVKLQARELESLKNEIMILKRKDPLPINTMLTSNSLPMPPTSVDVMLVQSRKGVLAGLGSPHQSVLPPIPINKSNSNGAMNSSNNLPKKNFDMSNVRVGSSSR